MAISDARLAADGITTEDVTSRQQQKDSPLYVGRVQVYPMAVRGRIRSLKTAALIVLLAIYYVMPWIRWDRGPGVPDQAVLADFVGQRFYFFWIEIWPQEIYYITGLLVLGAFGLFMATALFGRVWCGYACPQTVWTDLFMFVERWIEGDRNARIRLDKEPWNRRKLTLKTAKHTVWLAIALVTGGAWIMYFNDAPTLAIEFFTAQAGTGVYFFVFLFTATTYVLAGMAREQVCTYMCPWPRFQSALLDEDSLVVTYQRWRGEPRGKHRKGQSWDNRGDCIDCKKCVAVCPTGIDIRDGIQLECIGCGLCVDACNDVMARIGRPQELITFDSERNQQAKNRGSTAPPRFIRPRTIAYTAIIAVIGLVMLGSLALRSQSDITVQKDRNPLFVQLADGSIRNGYTIKIQNKLNERRTFVLTVEGLEGAELFTQGGEPATELTIQAEPAGVTTERIFITAPPPTHHVEGDRPESQAIAISLRAADSEDGSRHDSVFRSPP